MWLKKYRDNLINSMRKIEMMYVVISTKDSTVYGPFSSYEAADKWRDNIEKRNYDVGLYIKRVTSPATLG